MQAIPPSKVTVNASHARNVQKYCLQWTPRQVRQGALLLHCAPATNLESIQLLSYVPKIAGCPAYSLDAHQVKTKQQCTKQTTRGGSANRRRQCLLRAKRQPKTEELDGETILQQLSEQLKQRSKSSSEPLASPLHDKYTDIPTKGQTLSPHVRARFNLPADFGLETAKPKRKSKKKTLEEVPR